MNRFQYAESTLQQNESYIARELGVRIYDGNQKVRFCEYIESYCYEFILCRHRLKVVK